MANFKIIAAFKRNKNLKDYLVNASLGNEKKDKLNQLYKKVTFIRNIHTGCPCLAIVGVDIIQPGIFNRM